MASAASARPINRTPRGYFEAPNSLAVNLSLLTHAELCLVLVTCRQADGRPITDIQWQEWTGLHPRMKYNAAKGLKKRDCLTVDGKGNSAGFHFDKDAWLQYVAHAERSKPRTSGRRAVDPKPAQQVDPECRERGCGLLRMRCGETGLSPDMPVQDVKPVSIPAADSDRLVMVRTASADAGGSVPVATLTGFLYPRDAESTPSAATKVVKPVSTIQPVESLWAASLAVLRSVFPLVGVAFLTRLLATVCALFADVTDSELSNSIRLAWAWNRSRQKGEGLFLLTVPEALRFIRTGGDARLGSVTRAHDSPPFRVEDVRAFVGRNVKALKEAGYDAIACALAVLDVDALYPDLTELEERLTAIESAMVATARAAASDALLADVRVDVARDLRPYESRMYGDQRASLEKQFTERRLLELAKLPRLSLFYL